MNYERKERTGTWARDRGSDGVPIVVCQPGDDLGGGGRRPGGLAEVPIDAVDKVAPAGGGEKCGEVAAGQRG